MKPTLTLLAAGLLAGLSAAPCARAQDDPLALDFTVESFTLDNGLRVVVSPDATVPTVAVAVYYDVGSRNEVEGRSGFAHLFEHMMFQGSANIPKGGHFRYISIHGGEMNGTTSEDRTNYYQVLPSDRLELGLWLEADRMRSLDISEENFENQREVVKEERRLRIDNQPYMNGFLDFFDAAFDSWPYGHSVIGSMADLDAAALDDVQAFFNLYYVPNNAILVVVGDTGVDTVRTLAARHFGDIPRGSDPPLVSFDESGRQGPVELDQTDPLANLPLVLLGWQVPQAPDPVNDALRFADIILSGGQSSRLYRRLVLQEEAALEVSTDLEGRRGPDLFYAYAIAREADPATLQRLILEEIDRLVSDGFSDEEFEAARNQLIRGTLAGVETHLSRALRLGEDMLWFGEPDRVLREVARWQAMTPADVTSALGQAFDPTLMTVMRIHPPAADATDATEVTE
jgi:predicted Zn-dependent peptidase